MTEKINIALCLNSKYVMPSVTCMVSVATHNLGPIDFYILYSELQQSEIDFIQSTLKKQGSQYSVIPIHIDAQTFIHYPTMGRSKEAYFRLLIPKVLPTTVERCLYLDSDVIVKKSIIDFYTTDFENKGLVVCEDIGEILFFHKEQHALLNIPLQYKYFNSGVLLFNLNYFRTNFNTDRFFDYIKNNPEKLKFLDQDVLNALCYDKVTFVPSTKYNYMEILVNPIVTNNAMEEATIVHFIQKPWNYTYRGINARYWWKYARKLYPYKYLKFLLLNSIYTTLLKSILLIIPIQTLKGLKRDHRN